MMKFSLAVAVSCFFIAGCQSIHPADDTTMPECDYAIDGEAFEWDGDILHTGRIFAVDDKKFTLPVEVNEMHTNAYRADLNADGITDYMLVVFGTGNGSNFGMMDLYFFISCGKEYSLSQLVTYGGEVAKRDGKWSIRTVDRNGKEEFYEAASNATLNKR